MPRIPQSQRPATLPQGLPLTRTVHAWKAAKHTGLFGVSRRIADNRVIAGLHFEIDSVAGFTLAGAVDAMLGSLGARSEFKKIVTAAKIEFPQFA
jgi:hypothetical protein